MNAENINQKIGGIDEVALIEDVFLQPVIKELVDQFL
jgi:hypothetical protein